MLVTVKVKPEFTVSVVELSGPKVMDAQVTLLLITGCLVKLVMFVPIRIISVADEGAVDGTVPVDNFQFVFTFQAVPFVLLVPFQSYVLAPNA
jgi:hypothetical protein